MRVKLALNVRVYAARHNEPCCMRNVCLRSNAFADAHREGCFKANE